MGTLEPLPEQRAFIEREPDAHALLVAGPGTGKTFTLECRADFLVDQLGVDPDRIALLTLTRSLVRSLDERVQYGRAQTLHSFALAQLNRLGVAWDRRIVDPWEVKNIVRTDLKFGFELAYKRSISLTSVGDFLSRLGTAFRENQTEPPNMSVEERQLFQVFQQQRELFRYRLMDELVDDLVRLLEQGAEVAEPPTHVLADEYQDFTAGELRLLQLLAESFGTVIDACGDDRQSIFGFRAADPLALHRFPDVYGLEGPDYLWRSARCPQRICDLANRVAEMLSPIPGLERPELEPWEGRKDEGVVELVAASTPRIEARHVVRRCREFVDGGVRPNDIMVVTSLYHAQVFRSLNEEAGKAEELPFSFYDPRQSDPVADDRGVRLLSAGARLLVDADDHMAWRALVWAVPGLGDVRLKRLLSAGEATFLANLRVVASGDAVAQHALAAGETLVERFAGQPEIAANEIVDLLADELGCGPIDRAGVDSVRRDIRVAPPGDWVQLVVAISQPTQIKPEDMLNAIPVRTIFSAKGLESRIVFLVNALEQSFVGRGSIEDGIRNAYVGITRASEHLVISAPLFLGFSSLEHAVGTRGGGLAEMIAGPARQVGLELHTVRAEDL